MKTAILTIVLASIAGLMYRGDESLAFTQEPEDKELRVLLEAWRDTLKLSVKATLLRIDATSSIDPESVFLLSGFMREILSDELDLGPSKVERIALIEETLKDLMGLENRHERRGESAEILFQAKADRIKLEIELYKARKGNGAVLTDIAGENPAVNQMPEDPELRALLEARRDTLKTLVEVTMGGIQGYNEYGSYALLSHSEFRQELLSAELDLARSKEERIALIEEALKRKRGLENMLERRGEADVIILHAKADRIELEIDLHRARKKAK